MIASPSYRYAFNDATFRLDSSSLGDYPVTQEGQ